MHPTRATGRKRCRRGIAWAAAASLCAVGALAMRPASSAVASPAGRSSQPPLALDGSLALWWRPAGGIGGAGLPQPLPALRLRAGQGDSWKLEGVVAGAGAAPDPASAAREWPGGRVELSAAVDATTLAGLSVSRGLNSGGLSGPLSLADGRVGAAEGWATQAVLRRGGTRLEALVAGGLPMWRTHGRSVAGSGFVVAVETELPGRLRQPRAPAAGMQFGWARIGPGWLSFKTRPDVLVERHVHAVSTYLTARIPWGEWQAAASTLAWWQRDGGRIAAGVDAAALTQVQLEEPLPLRVGWSWSGPGFDWPLSRPLPRNRGLLQATLGPVGDRLRLKAQSEAAYDAAGGLQSSALEVDVEMRPPSGPDRVELSVVRRVARPGLQERRQISVAVRSGRDRAALLMSDGKGPVWEFETGRWPSPEVTVGLRVAPEEGSGRLQLGWQTGHRGRGESMSARLVYQWHRDRPAPDIRAEWSWQPGSGAEVSALVATDSGASAASVSAKVGLFLRYGASLR